MKRNSVEIRQRIDEAKNRCKEIIDLCKTEVREMTDDEEKELDQLKEEIEEKKRELEDLQKELESYDDKLPVEEEEEVVEEVKEEVEEEKNNRNYVMKNTKASLVKEIRSALKDGKKMIRVNADKRAVQVQGVSGVHDEVIETEIEGILEPLYAKSVLNELGVRWYTGLPMGDIQIPIMGAGSVGWAGEIAAANATSNTFTTKKLTPKRLTAYIDISKQLIAQDTIGVEAALRRDIVNALNNQLEATILGSDNKTDDKPAGIFYGVSPTSISDFEDVVELEATVESNNFNGTKKYLMDPHGKAKLRSMIKGTNNTGMVYEGGTVDGTPVVETTNVADNKYVFGDFSYLAVGSWGSIDITFDEVTQAVNGCVRLIVNAYFDACILDANAFAYGNLGE